MATPRRCLLPYPGSYAKTVNAVLKTACKTCENRENWHMPYGHVTAPEVTPCAAPCSATSAPTRPHPPLPPAFNVEAQESGHPGVRPRVLRRGAFNFEFRGRGPRNREGRGARMFEIGFVFVFGISVSIFFSRADARSRRKNVSKQKWFLGHVLDCMQRRSNGSCLVIAVRVAAWSKALPAPRIVSRLLSVTARFAARVCGQRAHCLRPVVKESSKPAQ